MALLIVVSLLTVVGIMGVAFAFSMYLETRQAREFSATSRARYVAEAGVSLARALLDEDRPRTRLDTLDELWAEAPAGADVDVDGDSVREARWWEVETDAGVRAGRYGVRVVDETGKINLNAGLAAPPDTGLGAINLTTLFAQASVPNSAQVAQSVETYRNGPDGRPGVALVDDDGDGTVDEFDEYRPLALLGDDRRLEGPGDLVGIATLDASAMARVQRLATTYSLDANLTARGQLRLNVNTATADELFPLLVESGVVDPWQAAVNLADFVDPDPVMSRLSKSVTLLWITDEGPLGGWTWAPTPQGHYRSTDPGGAALSWGADVPPGTYRVRALGVAGVPVGDLQLGERQWLGVQSHEYLGLLTLSSLATVTVEHPEGEEVCAFRGLELIPETVVGGTTVRGIEAVRINEVMVEPVASLLVSAATFDAQGSDWGCPVGQTACQNSGVGQGKWTWASTPARAGQRYRLRVFGAAAGQTVGQATLEGQQALLAHGETHPKTLTVGGDGKVVLTLGKTASEGTYYVQRIELSLQPDAEYVEVINLSPREVDLSGWTLEGTAAAGRQATVPAGTVVAPHGLLVLAVDVADTQAGLASNGISAREAWELPADVDAVTLEFAAGAPTADDDWLKTTIPGEGSAQLALVSPQGTVDEVEYLLPLATTSAFQSLEKGDPSAAEDADADGLEDAWYPALQLSTPGRPNSNDGMTEDAGGEQITHDPGDEVTVANAPLGGIGELAGLPSGTAWQPFASADLAAVADRLTVEGLRLETEGHLTAGADSWDETSDGYAFSALGGGGTAGQWQWRGVVPGTYRLGVYGASGEQMAVRWQQPDETWGSWSPALSTDAQGRVVAGQLTVGTTQAPTATLTLELECHSPGGVCHANHVWLDPQLVRVGPVNVNTAPLEVLRALPGMTDAVAQRLIAGRPYGDQDGKGRGIGDLLLGEVLGTTDEDRLEVFRRLGHLVTTRSDVFQVQSLGESLGAAGQTEGRQRIHSVVQRQ